MGDKIIQSSYCSHFAIEENKKIKELLVLNKKEWKGKLWERENVYGRLIIRVKDKVYE